MNYCVMLMNMANSINKAVIEIPRMTALMRFTQVTIFSLLLILVFPKNPQEVHVDFLLVYTVNVTHSPI